MRSVVRVLLSVLIAFLVTWLGSGTSAAAAPSTSCAATYTYDDLRVAAALANTTTIASVTYTSLRTPAPPADATTTTRRQAGWASGEYSARERLRVAADSGACQFGMIPFSDALCAQNGIGCDSYAGYVADAYARYAHHPEGPDPGLFDQTGSSTFRVTRKVEGPAIQIDGIRNIKGTAWSPSMPARGGTCMCWSATLSTIIPVRTTASAGLCQGCSYPLSGRLQEGDDE